jgi:hypothetical protein
LTVAVRMSIGSTVRLPKTLIITATLKTMELGLNMFLFVLFVHWLSVFSWIFPQFPYIFMHAWRRSLISTAGSYYFYWLFNCMLLLFIAECTSLS